MRTGRIGLGLMMMLAGPAQAECLGSCYDRLVAGFLALVVYVLIGVALLVMLARRKWRRAGLRGLALVVALAVGVPLVSQVWQRVQLWQLERSEVLGPLPAMADRVPLLIAPDWTCREGICAAVLMGRGATGAFAVPLEALQGRDLTAPVKLADLPLELWTEVEGGFPQRTPLTLAERADAAKSIDYLILSTQPSYRSDPGPFEAGLGLGEGVLMRLAMAPLVAGQGVVALPDLNFDLLNLTLTRAALAFPLAPGNWDTLSSDPLSPEMVARSLCGNGQAEPDWYCLNATWR